MEKILAIDFDGVIHGYQSGWTGYSTADDPPVPGVREFIEEMRKDYQIIVHSTRAETEEGYHAIVAYLSYFGIYWDDITNEKPPARVYLDDRSMLFTGTFEGLPEKIRGFKTWNGQP